MDDYGSAAGWHFKTDGPAALLEGPGGSPKWRLTLDAENTAIILESDRAPKRLTLTRKDKTTWEIQE